LQCIVNGILGICIETQQCSGTPTPGFCPGASNIQCCTDASCGPVPGVGSGTCRQTAECSGTSFAGYCSGPADLQCCTGALSPTPAPPPGGSFIPEPPNLNPNFGSCTSLEGAYQGTCIDVAQCTGATFNGVCPGSAAIKCCVEERNSVPFTTQYLNLTVFMQLHENLSTLRATAFQPYYNNALSRILEDNPSSFEQCLRVSGFAAQIGHESLGLLYMEEIASGAAYEGRCSDLGNCFPGDGPRYKGRGPIQLTGRYNYQTAGSFLGFNFEDNPEQVCFQSRGFEATVWYWVTRNLNQYCRTGSDEEFIQLTRAINGGTNGLDDRFARWGRARTILGC